MKSYLYLAALMLCSHPLWSQQYSVQDLPQLQDYESQRSSSFDQTGGNHDYVTVNPGETVKIFDQDGPGEIRHIWTTLPRLVGSIRASESCHPRVLGW